MRRIHDAHFATPLAGIPVFIFWLNLLGLTYLEHGSKWILLVFAILATFAFATLNNVRVRKNSHYHFGYNGPVDLKSEPQAPNPMERIEPTIAGQVNNETPALESQGSKAQPEYAYDHIGQSETSNFLEWQSKLNIWFAANKNLGLGLIGALVIGVIAVLILPMLGTVDPVEQIVEEQPQSITKERLNKIEMPDQFFIMLDQFDALTIAWEGDIKTESELGKDGSYWSAATAQGDKDCINLDFALGEKLRSLQVSVKNNGDYYADFSPVDTAIIIESIANKDRFKLCGYEFTLKGTRSLLRKNAAYKRYLE